MSKKILCLHHTDLDGAMSGGIVGYWAKEHDYEISYKPYNYGYDLFPSDFNGFDIVFAVDISFGQDNPWVYEYLGKRLIWIDHHKTAIEYEKDHIPFKVFGLREIGVGACELVWRYLFPNEKTPTLVQYLSAYDVWDKTRFDWELVEQIEWGAKEEYGNSAKCLCHYLELRDAGFYDAIEDLRAKGESILSYLESDYKAKLKSNGFYIPRLEVETVGSFRVLALNTNEFSSKVFSSVYNPEEFDIMIPFAIVPEDNKPGEFYVRVSFYTENPNIDVSRIAKLFGGGGHKGAAGCTMSLEDIQELLKGSISVKEYLNRL